MILDNELPASQRRVGETPTADRAAQSRRNGAAKIASGSSFSNIADEANSKTSAEVSAARQPVKENAATNFHAWQDSDFSFGDFLDIINPLQHLPIVATFYRNWTGDQIGMVPRVIGGALWGRIGGFVSGIVNSVVEAFTGKDVGDHIYAAIFGEPEIKAATTAVAQTKGLESAPTSNGGITSHEPRRVSGPEMAELPAEAAAVTKPHANASAGHETPLASPALSRRAIPPIELISRHILLHHYRRDEERDDATDYEKRLRVTA
jgi:hypothetical protein